MSELASYLGLDRSTITGLINRAEERGIVRRVGNENDRRWTRVTLTKDRPGPSKDLRRREISQQIAHHSSHNSHQPKPSDSKNS